MRVIDPCKCGGEGYIDWWQNFRKGFIEETFVRCDTCNQVGGSSDNEQDAIRLWNENYHAKEIT